MMKDKRRKLRLDKLRTLAVRLRELRGKRTLHQVSEATGITPQSLCHYELGNRIPGTDKLLILADYYNVSPNWLLGVENRRGDSNAKREKVKRFLSLANEIAEGGDYEL